MITELADELPVMRANDIITSAERPPADHTGQGSAVVTPDKQSAGVGGEVLTGGVAEYFGERAALCVGAGPQRGVEVLGCTDLPQRGLAGRAVSGQRRASAGTSAALEQLGVSDVVTGGELIEVMVERIPPCDLVIFHVMPARQTFLDLLNDEGESTP